MSKINNEDLNEKKDEKETLSAEDMEQVKGGAGYLKLGDIQGESVKLGDIKGESLKIGDIKGESQRMKLDDITLKRG